MLKKSKTKKLKCKFTNFVDTCNLMNIIYIYKKRREYFLNIFYVVGLLHRWIGKYIKIKFKNLKGPQKNYRDKEQ